MQPQGDTCTLRFLTLLLIIIAAFAFIGMNVNSLKVESVAFRPAGSNASAVLVNPPYTQQSHDSQEITVTLLYRGFGNTFLRLTPMHCFLGGFRVNGVEHSFPTANNQWCSKEYVVNLKPWLVPGANTLTFTANGWWDMVGMALGTPLMGANLAESLLTLLFVVCLLILLWRCLERQGFDIPARAIFSAACLLYLHQLSAISPFFHYNNDMGGHLGYIQALSNDFFHPYAYRGREYWHPPLYYWICALVAKGAGYLGAIDVSTAMRLVSLSSYLGMLYFGMRCFALKLRGACFYLASALLAFWPVGLLSYAILINNDILVYPLYAALFYFTLVWYETSEPRALGKALAACGLAFMVKTSALVPAAILASAVLFRLTTRRCTIRSLIDPAIMIGSAVLLAGLIFNDGNAIYCSLFAHCEINHLGGHGPYHPHWSNFLSFSVSELKLHPYFTTHELSLWDAQIKTMLFSWEGWNYPQIAWYLHVGNLMLIYILALAVIMQIKNWRVAPFPVIAGVILPLAASVVFTLLCHVMSCMDFRYIQPALIAMILLFFLVMQRSKENGWPLLYYAGNTTAAAFTILSIVFSQLQLIV